MAAAKKHSIYRHAYTDEPTKPNERYADLPKANESSEKQVVAASSRWVAMAQYGAGGPIAVRRLGELGRTKYGLINTHQGKVGAMDFSPFNSNLLYTGGDDNAVMAVQLPTEETAIEDIHVANGDQLFTLEGHFKKVSFVKHNPTAENILASSSWDATVRLWDVNTQEQVYVNETHPHTTFCLEWNRNGSLLATTCKDHKLRIFDPRQGDEATITLDAFESSKCSKAFWIPKHNWIGAYGFTKSSKRVVKIWDMANLEAPILTEQLDSSASIYFPTWDDETNLLWLWGKGDGSMSFNEITKNEGNGRPQLKNLGMHRSSTPTKGGCFLPKTALNTGKNEVAHFLKLVAAKPHSAIVPLSFCVPRKSGGFAADLFPDCPGVKAAQTAEDWRQGNSADPIMTSMDPETLAAAAGIVVEAKLTYSQLQAANAELKARVAALENELSALKGEN